jgi:hypothetical protein
VERLDMYESYRSVHHEREDADMREDVNAYVMEPLMDAWLCGAQVPGRMSKEKDCGPWSSQGQSGRGYRQNASIKLTEALGLLRLGCVHQFSEW